MNLKLVSYKRIIMCGIFTLLNNENYTYFSKDFIKEQFEKGRGRGPEDSKLDRHGLHIQLGFHRLAINGLNDISNQPIILNDIVLICNGEIYNYKELYDLLDVIPSTNSDCEVIIHLYKKYGIEYTLSLLDGVFSFILLDNSINVEDTNNTINCSKLYVARDPYGVRPLYILKPNNEKVNPIYGFASELKVLSEFYQLLNNDEYDLNHFEPGTYSEYYLSFKVLSLWKCEKENVKYHMSGFESIMFKKQDPQIVMNKIYGNIREYLYNAVQKRCLTTERPIACLLSGGLDSSLITALVNDCLKRTNRYYKPLETYSIGLEGSEDLKYARIVADYLKTNHTEIVLTEQDFFDAIPEVIYTIESYDTTSVRASIGNYLLGKYISKNSNAKVIFNGDGSDELCGGYLYMNKCPSALEFDKESRRLLKDIHRFDVLRSDKCISSHGLEPRTPFLDRAWVQYYLSIHPEIRYHPGNNGQCEKFLLRKALSEYKNVENIFLLPDEILWRKKEAFSDGVSGLKRSLYEILQEKISDLGIDNTDYTSFKYHMYNEIKTKEHYYYRHLFEKSYSGLAKVVPYFWMPKYIESSDPSARTLSIYIKD